MNLATIWRRPTGDSTHGECGYIPRPSAAWSDDGADSFYVYILKLDRGGIYVGQTRELRERMLEHREGKTSYTAGRNPRLQYFEVLPSRHEAMLREVEIKRLARQNHREILRMITRFHDLVGELDFGLTPSPRR